MSPDRQAVPRNSRTALSVTMGTQSSLGRRSPCSGELLPPEFGNASGFGIFFEGRSVPQKFGMTHMYVKNTPLTNSYDTGIFALYEKIRTSRKLSNIITREKGNVCTGQTRTKTTFDCRNRSQPGLRVLDVTQSYQRSRASRGV